MAIGSGRAAVPTTPLGGSRPQVESPAQPQSPQRPFARRLVIGLGCKRAGQSPGPLPGDQGPPPPVRRQLLALPATPLNRKRELSGARLGFGVRRDRTA